MGAHRVLAGIDPALGLGHELLPDEGRRIDRDAGLREQHESLVEGILQCLLEQRTCCLYQRMRPPLRLHETSISTACASCFWCILLAMCRGPYLDSVWDFFAVEDGVRTEAREGWRRVHVHVKEMLLPDHIRAMLVHQAVLIDVGEHRAVAACSPEGLDRHEPGCVLEPELPCRLVEQHPSRQEHESHLARQYRSLSTNDT